MIQLKNKFGWSKGLTKETDERVRKGAESKKGHKAWNKDKKGLQVAWNKDLTTKTDIRVKKIRDKQLGRKRLDMIGNKNPAKRAEVRKKLVENNPMKRKECRDKIGISNKKNWKDPKIRKRRMEGIERGVKGIPKTKETKKKMSEAKINNPNRIFKDTSIELEIEAELKRRNINYQKQVPLCKIAIVDFYLPEENIVIECDGDYWHRLPGVPENDKRKTKILIDNKYKVFRFWESEINKSSKKCIDKIINR